MKSLESQVRYTIVINEIMADPAPPAGLPNSEWIELTNTNDTPVDLQGWQIGNRTSQSGPLPSFILYPDSYVIICNSNSAPALSVYGNVLAVTSFPSLGNDGDELFLRSVNGMIIHAVSYSAAWYRNALKKEGGWTLEMVDNSNPCMGYDNWKASENVNGGTPGVINSVNGATIDLFSPVIEQAYAIDNSTIVLVSSEPLDSLIAANSFNYTIDGGLSVTNATTISPSFTEIHLKTNSLLDTNKIYTITISNLADCQGNIIQPGYKVVAGLSSDADVREIVINEILFNPGANGFDFLEIYNRSNKIIDAGKLYLANRNSSNAIGSIMALSARPRPILPGGYLVATVDASILALNYFVQDPKAVLEPSSFPSFPDDKGTAVLLDQQGKVLDEVSYVDKWHFKLIDNPEGISLERIDPAGSSQEAGNWHSAASTSGYGTPGYKNSQFKTTAEGDAMIEILPKIFSPDNDGFDDIATIKYKIPEPGYVANITIFDAAGRPVRNLVRNATLSASGYWNWNGLDDKGQKLAVGVYIFFTEIFNLEGKKRNFKNTVVVAGKLK